MTPGILPTADKLFAAMGINEPLPRVEYVTTRPIDFDMSGFTAQERQWIAEAEAGAGGDGAGCGGEVVTAAAHTGAAVDAERARMLSCLSMDLIGGDRSIGYMRVVWMLGRYDALVSRVAELEKALRVLVYEGECYCSTGTANRDPCGHCCAQAALASKEQGK